jgi:hypothetical protein
MFLSFGLLIDAILLVLGVLWCREMFSRWRRDLQEFRTTKDASTRQALGILWAATAVIVVLELNFLVGFVRAVVRLL